MFLHNEFPFLCAHDGGYVARCNQRIEPGRLGFQQHRDSGPGQPPGQQHEQVIGSALGKHRRNWCRCGLESGGKEYDRLVRILGGYVHDFGRRGNRPNISACGLGLFE